MTVKRILKDEGWKDHAACTGRTDVNFYPERGESAKTAKEICATCPVRQACLTYAQTPPYEMFGVFGGLSERQRQRRRTERWQRRQTTANDMEVAS